jgi:hypothetical protein
MAGIILSKVLRDKHALPRQVLLYREFIRLVFSEARPASLRPQLALPCPGSPQPPALAF